MKKLAWTALAVAALIVSAQPRPAEAEDFGIEPDKKLERALEDLADVMFECGDEAKGKGLYTYTRSFFNYGLEYDPDHRKIRKTMGFKKRRGEWVREEDMVPESDKINESKRGELLEKLRLDTAEIREEAANELWEDFVTDTELPLKQRLLALYHVVRIYPEHRGAQKATRSTPAEMWFKHELDSTADVQRVRWIDGAAEGEPVEEKTEYIETSGIPMDARESDWFMVHMDIGDKGQDWAKKLIKYAEATRKHNLEMLGLEDSDPPEELSRKLHYSVFIERERFARFVEKCSGIPDASSRRERAQHSGGTEVYNPPGACWLYPNLDNDYGLRDGLAHDLGYKDIIRHMGSHNFYWMARGMGYMTSAKMNGSVQSKFYAVRSTGVFDTGGAEALPGFGPSPAGWRLDVGMRVAGGTNQTLSGLMGTRGKDYGEEEMAAAFCFMDYLINEHSEKLGEFLQGAYKTYVERYREKQEPESANELLTRLLETLGMEEDAFMDAFQIWVLDNYFELPVEEE